MNNLGNVYTKQQEYLKAIEMYNAAIELDDQYADAFLNRGFARELTGDLDAACSDWQMAFSLGIQEAEQYLKECK